MNDFYASTVHNRINSDAESTRQRYRQRIARELSWMGWREEAIAGKTIFDVGTGWQALTFIELGAREVHHRDLSSAQVDALNREMTRRGIGNLHSRQGDLCSPWDVDGAFDLIFLLGVFHHLADPGAMLEQALERLKPGGSLYLRLYRSGTWSRWLTAHLRPVAATLSPSLMERVYTLQFPLELERDGSFLGNMLDDLFTPVWGAFHPETFLHNAAFAGGSIKTEEDRYHWDFSDRDENFRVLFTRSPQGSTADRATRNQHPVVIAPVDQRTLPLTDPQARRIGHLLQQSMDALLEQSHEWERACALLTLYRLVRRFHGLSYFTLSRPEPSSISAFVGDLQRKRLESLEILLQRWGSSESR
ncbi:MAG: class I SAM-dependent methyltransferase [Magnetococcales bacterium]|nr:class I SAM-dependent methyltransferase [Magnetococcales bacterium]MBF0150031.1 class I SAM-dependent methyltransferase [Magnetococcales bacterium]